MIDWLLSVDVVQTDIVLMTVLGEVIDYFHLIFWRFVLSSCEERVTNSLLLFLCSVN